jgi:hypothetical protein
MMIQIGPQRWMDAELARLSGVQLYTAPKAASLPCTARRTREFVPESLASDENQFATIDQAMAKGATNEVIERSIQQGTMTRPTYAEALQTWAPSAVREAVRRGLIWQ